MRFWNSGILLLFLFLYHHSRNDQQFLQYQLPKFKQDLFLEYLFLSVPAFFGIFFHTDFLNLLLLASGIFLISMIPFTISISGKQNRFDWWIPVRYFEWRSGWRKQGFLLAFLWILSLGLCWVKILPLIFLWLLTTGFCSFYQEGENRILLLSMIQKPGLFLRQKLWQHNLLLLFFLAPVLLIQLCLFSEIWWVYPVFLFFQCTMLSFSILFKYALYDGNQTISVNQILTGIVSLGCIFPAMFPVPLILMMRFNPKALRNLQSFLPETTE